jgi:hypothetical protein
MTLVRLEFRSGSAEVGRLALSKDQVRDLLLGEADKRRQAATEFDRLGEEMVAARLREEALVAMRYANGDGRTDQALLEI